MVLGLVVHLLPSSEVTGSLIVYPGTASRGGGAQSPQSLRDELGPPRAK